MVCEKEKLAGMTDPQTFDIAFLFFSQTRIVGWSRESFPFSAATKRVNGWMASPDLASARVRALTPPRGTASDISGGTPRHFGLRVRSSGGKRHFIHCHARAGSSGSPPAAPATLRRRGRTHITAIPAAIRKNGLAHPRPLQHQDGNPPCSLCKPALARRRSASER